MEVIAGKTVLTTLDEIVDPGRTALLIVDVQNEFCSPDSVWLQDGKKGDAVLRAVSNIRLLLDQARSAGVMIVYVKMVTLPGLKSWSPAYTRFMILKNKLPLDKAGSAPGSWEAEVVAEIAPRPGDLVIEKYGSSGFIGTDLEAQLRSAGKESVIVCGVATHACVESTIRDAFNKDFYVVEVEDCVAAFDEHLHRASLEVMRTRVDVVSMSAVIEAWPQKSMPQHRVAAAE